MSSSSHGPNPSPSPSADDALNSVLCSVCQRKQRLGSRYCDMCGKRLSVTRISEAGVASPSLITSALTSAASVSAASASSPSSSIPIAPLSKRLWDRPLPSISSARSSLVAVRTVHSFLSALVPIENAYIAAVTKLTCQMNTDGMQAATSEGWSFFVQFYIDRVRGKYREVRKIEKAVAALTEVTKGSDSVLARMEKEVAEQQKLLRKEVEALQKAEAKHHKRRSTSANPQSASSPSAPPHLAQTFSRWKLTVDEEESKNRSPASSALAGGKDGSSSGKLTAAQQSEHRVRAQHNSVVIASLHELERLQQDKAAILREVMLQLIAEISHDTVKAYHSAVAVRDKVDAIDATQEVRDWARAVESGVPCTWIVPTGGEAKAHLAALLRTLREDSMKDGTGSGESTPKSRSGSGEKAGARGDSRPHEASVNVSLPQGPLGIVIPRASSISYSIISTTASPAATAAAVGKSSSPPPPHPPSLPARALSVVKPSPRVMADSHHQLVVQPSRFLRLDHIATPTLASSTSATDYLPWLPPHPSLSSYHVQAKQWEMLAVESLLLSPLFLTPGPDGPPLLPPPSSVAATALEVLRAKTDLSPPQMEELLASLHFPYRSSSPATLNPLLPTVNYRLLLLRTVDESSFRSLKQFSSFYQRQCHAVLCSLLWHIVNAGGEGGVKEWHHNQKVYSQERMMGKVLDRVKGVLDVYCEGGGDDYSQRRKERCDALAVVMEEVVRDLRGDEVKKKDSVLRRMMRGGKKEAPRQDEAGEDALLFFPLQVRHNCYRHLIYAAMIKSSDTQLIHSRSPSTSATASLLAAEDLLSLSQPSEREAERGEKEVEEKMAILHPHYGALLSVLSSFSSHQQLSPLFTSLCFISVLLDIISDQSLVQECSPLSTPALRSSDLLLALLEENVGGLKAKKEAEGGEDAEDQDDVLHHFFTRSLQHFDNQFTVYLSHYHQSSPPLLLRVCELYAVLLELLHPPSSFQSHELERVYLREKKVSRILQRSVTAEYGRVRGAFDGRVRGAFDGRMDARHWKQIAEEVETIAMKEKDVFHRALMPVTHTSLDVTLPTLSSLFVTDMTAALAEHPSADPFFLALFPRLAHLQSIFLSLSSSLSDPYLLTSTLLDLSTVVPSHLRQFVSQQVTNTQQWVRAHIENESWEAVDESLGCSSSIIDTHRLLFATVDTFFAALAALLPHSLAVLPFLLSALNESINFYATQLHMSCGEEVAGCPLPSMATEGSASAMSSPASMLTRARSLISDKTAQKPGLAAVLSQNTLTSLCVRLCNLSVAKERLPALHTHIAAHWEEMKTRCDPQWIGDVQRVEEELQLLPPANSPVGPQQPPFAEEAQGVGLFSNAAEHLQQCSQAILSLIASRTVFVDWHTPLLTVLYFPLPSSPAVSFRDSGFFDLLDSTMLDLYRGTGDSNFAGVCEWVWRYLLHAMEWVLVGRERGKGANLLEVGVIRDVDVAVLENDLKEMKELFIDDLGEERMGELSLGYEALLQKLRYRVQSNQMTPKGTAANK